LNIHTGAFPQHTGLTALDDEAVHLPWAHSQLSYASYQQMQTMAASLKEGSLVVNERLDLA
jgi:hypothetical protein